MHIVVRELSKSYGHRWALRDASVELRAGDCVALLGPNGAGKTTFLRLLCALLEPSHGEIEMDGKKLRDASGLRSAVGFLAPDEHLYENLTVAENLRLFNALYGAKKSPEEIRSALRTVQLEPRANEYFSSLSTGMKCRASIAKWLLIEPKLLLLDEPFGVLDGSGIDLLESFLRRVCARGGIVVVATHHVARALRLCSRGMILHRGRLIFDEPRREPWESFHRAFAEFLPRGEPWTS